MQMGDGEEKKRLSEEQEEFLRNPIGAGTITHSAAHDMKLYQGTVPFKEGDEVYMIKQEVFSGLIKNCLSLLLQSNVPMSDEMIGMFPDSLHFTDTDEETGEEREMASLFLDRNFYSHDGEEYAYVRFASIGEFNRTGDLVRKVDYSKGDSIEDIVIERDNMNKYRAMQVLGLLPVPPPEEVTRTQLDGNTLYRGPDGKVYWSDGQDEYEIQDFDNPQDESDENGYGWMDEMEEDDE